MLVIIYRHHQHQHARLDRRRWGAPRHISTRQRVATEKQTNREHRRDGWRPESWGWLEWLWLVSWSSQFPSLQEREMTSSRARMSGTRRDVPADCCRGVWTVLGRSGAEWREAPMQDGAVGGWASRGQGRLGFLVDHIQLLIVLEFLWKLFISPG